MVSVAVPERLDVGWRTRSWRIGSEDEATADSPFIVYANFRQLDDLPVKKAISSLEVLLHCRLLPTMLAV